MEWLVQAPGVFLDSRAGVAAPRAYEALRIGESLQVGSGSNGSRVSNRADQLTAFLEVGGGSKYFILILFFVVSLSIYLHCENATVKKTVLVKILLYNLSYYLFLFLYCSKHLKFTAPRLHRLWGRSTEIT